MANSKLDTANFFNLTMQVDMLDNYCARVYVDTCLTPLQFI